MVQAMARMTAMGADPERFARAFAERIASLAARHDLLVSREDHDRRGRPLGRPHGFLGDWFICAIAWLSRTAPVANSWFASTPLGQPRRCADGQRIGIGQPGA
jgi:HWE histidine kinase